MLKSKRIFIFLQGLWLLLLFPMLATGQTLSLDSCRSKARANYPLVRQYDLIEKTTEYNLSNANKGYLPQFNLSLKATYQSDVTEIPSILSDVLSKVSGRPVTFPSLSKDQYQATLDVSQLIWDGGLISAQKKSIKASSEADRQKVEVDLYALNERVNNLYFGVLLIGEQLKQNAILQNELAENYKRVSAYKQNGVAQQSDLDAIQVEQINASQRETDLKSARKSYLQILSAFVGEPLDENVTLEKPVLPAIPEIIENKRPELQLLDAQSLLFESQRAAVKAANLPKLGFFMQGGYGRPGLNMFAGTFSPYYIGGLRFSWNISGLYTQKNNLEKIDLSKKSVEVQKETFLFNNDLVTKQQQNDIDKLRQALKSDEEIIRLRKNIKKASEAKVANGTLTVTDLLRDVDAENMAIQSKALHEVQLYMSVYQLKNNTNN